MVSLVVYGIIAIALASAAGYAFLVFTNSSKEVDYTLQNSLRMDTAVAGIRASLLALSPGSNNGVLFPPMGQSVSDNQGGTYTGIPPNLGAIETSPWGQPYAYCPLSPTNSSGLTSGGGNTLTTGVNVVSPPTSSQYTVTTYSGIATSSTAYVVANTGSVPSALTNAASNGYVAFILSSQGPGLPVPTCSQITYNATTNAYGVSGGTVRGVTATLPYLQHAVAAMDRMEIYVGSNATNDGTGRDIYNLATMDTAMGLWSSLQPRETTIWITAPVTIDSSLNVEDSRLYSGLGEGPALTLASLNGVVQTLTLATNLTTYPQAYEFNSPITFENLTVGLNGPITVTKPLTLKGVTLGASSANTAINLVGTTLLSENVAYSNVALTLANADGEFYNLSEHGYGLSSTFTTSSINANASRLTFDGQASGSTFTFGSSSQANLTAVASQINISPQSTLVTNATTDSMIVFDTNVSVQGNLTLGGSASLGGLDAIAGSGVFVSGTLTNSSANTMEYVAYLNGSTMDLEGTLHPNAPTVAAIGLQQSQLTSSPGTAGKITQGGNQAYACVDLIAGVAGMAPELQTGSITTLNHFKIFAAGSGGSGAADKIYFNQAQFGMPPLADWQNTPNGSTLDSNNAAYFNTASGRAPIVYNTATTFPTASGSVLGYVDSASLEEAVRNMVNAESITGSGLNFAGTCQ
jgi:hypothetical protein